MLKTFAIVCAALVVGGAAQAQPALHPLRGDEIKWIAKPSGNDMAEVYPGQARRNELSGRTLIECQTTVAGFLSACTVLSELPRDMGFGAAALKLARRFRMDSKTVSGTSLEGGVVEIPILFTTPDDSAMPLANDRSGDPAALITRAKGNGGFPCPTAAEPAQRCQVHAFSWDKLPPRMETADLVRGAVGDAPSTALTCAAIRDGHLADCVAGGHPSPQQDAAMRGLVAQLTPPVLANDKTPMTDGSVRVEFNWAALNQALDASVLTARR